MESFGAVLTTQGNSLLIDAAAGRKIEFTRLVTGCGEYNGTENLKASESLKEQRQSFPFLRYEKVSDESVLLTAIISNEGLVLGYRMTEIGIYGRMEGEQEEILCSIAVIQNREEADFWPPWNGLAPMQIVQRYYITISPEAVPTIAVDNESVLAEIAKESRRAQSEEERLQKGFSDLENKKIDKIEGKGLSSNDYTDIEKERLQEAYNKRHSHQNSSVLETLSVELLTQWNSAVEHITDIVKHITDTERERWNEAWNKCHSHSNTSILEKITQAMLDKLEGIAEGANHYAHPTGAGYKHIPAGGSSGQILRWSADGTAQWGNDNNTTYGNMKAATASAAGGAGLVPAPAAGAQGKYLRGDGTWQTPPNTTYGAMTGASASAAGKAGLVPAPAAGAQGKYLRGDGTWQDSTVQIANNDTTTAAGWVADARIVRQHGLEIDQLSSDISKAIGYIDYTSATDLSNIGTGATISEDGVVRMIAIRYGTGACEPKLYINDVMVSSQNIGTYVNSNTESNYFPVRKGDTIRATFSGCDGGRVEFCRFRS